MVRRPSVIGCHLGASAWSEPLLQRGRSARPGTRQGEPEEPSHSSPPCGRSEPRPRSRGATVPAPEGGHHRWCVLRGCYDRSVTLSTASLTLSLTVSTASLTVPAALSALPSRLRSSSSV